MSYVPDVMVEIAFDSGYSTPAADRTWTDVSEWVELADNIDIVFGRQNERSTADANTLSLTLDNSDGRFTARLASSPYYPNVRVGRPIRVTTTPVGGAASVRFVGFVDSWPVAWEKGTDETATASITATSRLTRLGYDAQLRSIVEESILRDGPIAYYTLGEADGAPAASDSSGLSAEPLARTGDPALPVVFGTAIGPGTDGLTAATFAGIGGQWLSAGSQTGPTTPAEFTIETFFNTNVVNDQGIISYGKWEIGLILGPPSLIAINSGSTVLDVVRNLADGATHHVALVVAALSRSLYVDGVLVDSDASGSFAGNSLLTVGWSPILGGAFNGVLAHVAIYPSALSAAEIFDHAAAGRDGFETESAADRLEHYASFAGVPATELSSVAATPVVHVETTGSSAVDLMRAVEAAEGGAAVLFDDRDGTLTLTARDSRNAPTGITLDFGRQEIGGDFVSGYNRDFVVNDASATNAAGTITAHVVNTDSRDDLGPMATTLTTIAVDDGAPYRAAAWLVNTSAEPKPRTPALTVDLLPFTAAPSQNDVLDATIGTLLTVTSQPSQAPTSTGYYFVEGYTETIGPASYQLSFNVSPGEPYTNLVIFDDADRGFDSGAVFGY